MINIQRLTEADKGRSVIYCPSSGICELGTIRSWNEKFIFVLYTSGNTAASTDPEDLSFCSKIIDRRSGRTLHILEAKDGQET